MCPSWCNRDVSTVNQSPTCFVMSCHFHLACEYPPKMPMGSTTRQAIRPLRLLPEKK